MLVLPLGDRACAEVVAAVERQFGQPAALDWLDRRDLRRHPLRAVWQLTRRAAADAVLVVPDLRQPRLRLTGLLLLLLPRARRRWLLDLDGRCQRFEAAPYLRANLLVLLRHTVAVLLALALGEPLLRLLERLHTRPSRPPRRPSRVLYLRSLFWFGLEGGGSVTHTAGVITGLQQGGAQVRVLSSDRLPEVSAPVEVVAPETWFDGSLRELEELVYNVPLVWRAWRASRRWRPQLIYQRHTAFSVAGAILSWMLKVPLVLEFNSSEVWKARYWGGLQRLRLASLVERINLQAAERIVVVSEALQRDLVARGISPRRILVNPNGVDAGQFRPDLDGAAVRRQLGIAPEAIVVGFSGTFGVWHGIPSLAAALPRVLAARPGVVWLLIGDGALRPLIDAAIAEGGLATRVRLPGLVPHAAMPGYLAACDILVSPHTRQADGGEFFGSPTKLFEYMAMGRPIVASGVGQIAQVLRHEQSALLVPPDDPAALTDAILRLVDDVCLRQRLGTAARAAAEAHHTWQQHAERLLTFLEAA